MQLAEGWHKTQEGGERYSHRLAAALPIAFFCAFTVFFVAPVELVVGNRGSLMVDPLAAAILAAVLSLAIALLFALAISFLKGRAFDGALGLACAAGVASWVQALFMNAGLPPADGASIDWRSYDPQMAVSALVWALLLVGGFVFSRKKPRAARALFLAISIVLVIVQGAGVASVLAGLQPRAEAEMGDFATTPTEEGLFDLAPSNNVIVFVLDTIDTRDVLRLSREDPEKLEPFCGFTWYTNVSGSFTPTRYAVPYLLTGTVPGTDEAWSEFLVERYHRSSYLSDIKDAGYAVGIYTDSLWLDKLDPSQAKEWVAQHTINLHRRDIGSGMFSGVNINTSILALAEAALYRDLPWLLKPRFWFTTDWMNAQMVGSEGLPAEHSAYVIDDAAFHRKLKARGLSVVDRDGYRGAFRFIHLAGTHVPYNLDENGEGVADGASNLDAQLRGSMRIVQTYLEQLRVQGLYEDATIIVTSDHGVLQLWDPLTYTVEPFLFVKLPCTAEEASRPLAADDSEVIHGDILPTVIEAVGKDPHAYPGMSLFEPHPDRHETRSFYTTLEDRDLMYRDLAIIEWQIDGDVLDFGNWHESGRVWDGLQ